MIQEFKSVLKASLLFIGGSLMLLSCESDPDNLGSQFFQGNEAKGVHDSINVIAYNIKNNDTIQSDGSKLANATLGAFTEPQFGMQKSAFVSQVRLSSYDPDFGTNPTVDSVVMVMKPLYASDSATTVTDENYTFPDGNVAAKKVMVTYPVLKYGKTKINGNNAVLTLNVHQVDDFLGNYSDKVYSNKTVNYSTLVGSKAFDGYIRSLKITKKSDNSDLLIRDAEIRIPLDKTYFQTKIFNKKGQPELQNVSNFIRYFKGLRVSVAENDGYIFKFTPGQTAINIYYKRDVTSNGTTTNVATAYTMNLGGSNAFFNQIDYDRTGAAITNVLATSNSYTGDAKIYAQGMGGPNFGIRIPQADIEQIRNLYKTNKVGILSANIRLYSDTSVWNNKYTKPSFFTVQQKDVNAFLTDVTTFSANAVYSLVKSYDLDKTPAYYDIGITKTFKDIIENGAENKDFIFTVANYELSSTTGGYAGYNLTTRAYTPNRIVLVGTDPSNAKRAQLRIIYAKK